MTSKIEWPTLGLIITTYVLWALVLWLTPTALGIVILGILIAFQSSLQHEALHGHPTQNKHVNAALVFVSLIVLIPYTRFRDTHLAHHNDADLTDPYDDPETNFLDPAVWAKLPAAARLILRVNNTLLGRLILGPAIGTISFFRSEIAQFSPRIAIQWAAHFAAVAIVVAAVWISPHTWWQYAIAVYIGTSLLKLRTFLEHQAADRISARSAIVERGGGLGFLFLFNNLHVVHHMHPKVPWYALPALYQSNKAHYQRRNGGYVFGSYWQILKTYAWRAKDPVPHPLRPRR